MAGGLLSFADRLPFGLILLALEFLDRVRVSAFDVSPRALKVAALGYLGVGGNAGAHRERGSHHQFTHCIFPSDLGRRPSFLVRTGRPARGGRGIFSKGLAARSQEPPVTRARRCQTNGSLASHRLLTAFASTYLKRITDYSQVDEPTMITWRSAYEPPVSHV